MCDGNLPRATFGPGHQVFLLVLTDAPRYELQQIAPTATAHAKRRRLLTPPFFHSIFRLPRRTPEETHEPNQRDRAERCNDEAVQIEARRSRCPECIEDESADECAHNANNDIEQNAL